MSITLNGTTGIIADNPATVKANAFLDAAGGNTATITSVLVALASQAQAEADPLFFKAQRGEATLEEWLAVVADIQARFPYPAE